MCFNIVFILFLSTAADLKVIIDDNNYILALKMCIQNINHYRNIKKKLVTDTVRLGQLRLNLTLGGGLIHFLSTVCKAKAQSTASA